MSYQRVITKYALILSQLLPEYVRLKTMLKNKLTQRNVGGEFVKAGTVL